MRSLREQHGAPRLARESLRVRSRAKAEWRQILEHAVPSSAALAPAIYGTIAVGSLLAVESARRETYGATVASVMIALILYWLAHSYSEFASGRLRRGQPLTLPDLARALLSELSIVFGAALPMAVLLFLWVIGARLGTAVSAAIWASAATIVIIEIVAGLRAKQAGKRLALQVMFGAVLGLLIISLRLVLA
jgi:hypothetical protein